MITIYTDKSKIPEDYELITINDRYFKRYIFNQDKKLSYESISVMKNIDRATIIEGEDTEIRTPFGRTNLLSLSTGCKTFINIIETEQEKKKIFSLDECGINVLNKIFEYIDNKDSNKIVYISSDAEISKVDSKLSFRLNGEREANKFDIIDEVLSHMNYKREDDNFDDTEEMLNYE